MATNNKWTAAQWREYRAKRRMKRLEIRKQQLEAERKAELSKITVTVAETEAALSSARIVNLINAIFEVAEKDCLAIKDSDDTKVRDVRKLQDYVALLEGLLGLQKQIPAPPEKPEETSTASEEDLIAAATQPN